jgi:hypothetical protein
VSTPPIIAPYLAATVMLGAAGAAKFLRPDDTTRALRLASIPAGRATVRTGALLELAVAVAALAAPGPVTGGLVAASYGAFTVFVLAALIRGWPLSSCGCFGRPDARPTYAHAALDLAAVGVAVWWSLAPPAGIARVFSHGPWHGGPLVLVSLVIAGLSYLVWTNPVPGAAQ